VKARGIVHVHSTLSFDGHASLEELRELVRSHGFQFVLLAEHIEQLDRFHLAGLIDECRRLSDRTCVLVPGLEIEDQTQYFLGMTRPVDTDCYEQARRQLIDDGAYVVLAHPHRLRRTLSTEEMEEIKAIEVWNVKDDGYRVPGYIGTRMWRDWPRPVMPIAGLDLHQLDDFRDLGIVLELPDLTAEHIRAALHAGAYHICRAGEMIDPTLVPWSQRLLGYTTWSLRRVYRRLRGKRQLVPARIRRVLHRGLKG
jgi:hypothetical protein